MAVVAVLWVIFFFFLSLSFFSVHCAGLLCFWDFFFFFFGIFGNGLYMRDLYKLFFLAYKLSLKDSISR